MTTRTARLAALALATGLVLSGCQSADPAEPFPVADDPPDQTVPSEFTWHDTPPGSLPTVWHDGWSLAVGQGGSSSTEAGARPGPTSATTSTTPQRPTTASSPGASPGPTHAPTPAGSPGPTPAPGGSPGPSPSPASSPTASPSAPPTTWECPDARTCGEYDLLGGRWPAGPDGTVTIGYRIRTEGWVEDPSGVRKAPGADEMVAMIRAAVRTWMDANPRLRLVYDGVTTDEPANGNNVIGWGTSPGGAAGSVASTHFTPDREGPTYTGFHVIIERTKSWSWDPCDPDNGQPCSDDPNASVDFQGTVAHEWGHVLGLDHPCEDGRCNPDELTMWPSGGRSLRTLGLGDVLGVRDLYPTNAPMPTIHRP